MAEWCRILCGVYERCKAQNCAAMDGRTLGEAHRRIVGAGSPEARHCVAVSNLQADSFRSAVHASGPQDVLLNSVLAKPHGKVIKFPQHPAEAAEREESDGCKDGLADDGQARLSCTGKRTASHGSDAGIDRAGKGVALAAALHPASAKCQQSDAVVSGGSQNRASEYPISPADSSQNFSSELFTALVSAGGVL